MHHIFFDLDHTLWDYEANSTAALKQLYLEFELWNYGLISENEFIASFHRANFRVWHEFSESSLNRDALREKRLQLVFEEHKLPCPALSGFHEAYYQSCSQGTKLIAGAKELVEVLSAFYELHIITNGFDDAQFNKIHASGLAPYISTITTSEMAKAKKPESAYFRYALDRANAAAARSLIIGDGFHTDVQGALAFGLPCIWFNPDEQKHQVDVVQVKGLFQIPTLCGLESFYVNES